MERHKIEKKRRKKPPRVPIKTYRWEDIRRARLRGGYPWTYLYKEPFGEEVDPFEFTMEGMPKSKSSSMLGTTSDDGVSIQDVTSEDSAHPEDILLAEPSSYIVITEVPSDSSDNHSNKTKEPRAGSMNIREEMEVEVEQLNLELDSGESSDNDNISEYLDKEETEHVETGIPEEQQHEEGPDEGMDALNEGKTSRLDPSVALEQPRIERAKSEEPKRKRKLSIESSYSRKSLSKLAFLKKLKEAKEKIKVPKLSMPNLFKKDSPVDKTSKKVDEGVKSAKPPEKRIERPSVAAGKPVYIHIPLKPPEGQTDEFSHLEFEDPSKKAPPEEEKPEGTKPEGTKAEGAKPEGTLEITTIQDTKIPEIVEPEPEETATNDKPSDDEGLSEIDKKLGYDTRRFSGHPDEIVAIEILKTQSIDLHENGIDMSGGDDIFIVQQDPNSKNKDDVIIILSNTDEAGSSKAKEQQQQQQPTKSLSRQSSRKVRAKSAEPERKRKSSLESVYSRRSMSKLGFLKKLKDATDKIKFPKLSLSRSNSKRGDKSRDKDKAAEKQPQVVEKEEKLEPTKPMESTKPTKQPKYIHIPLKPPPGQTDEFSHLEFEEKKGESPKKQQDAEAAEQASTDSPATAGTNDVQFIYLTPPSDDELLDHPDVPETPQSSDVPFFTTHKIEELKKIAKGAVDTVSPTPKLESVSEERTGDKVDLDEAGEEESNKPEQIPETKPEQALEIESSDAEKIEEKAETKPPKDDSIATEAEPEEKMVIDEEDGLKLTESAMAKQVQQVKSMESQEQLKSSLKTDGSPVLKKKVSFKRRSRDESKTPSKDAKDGIYEDIQAPKEEQTKSTGNLTDEQKNKVLEVMGNSQSMSMDEEKSYLEEKIIKDTSLDEDYNRWSKMSDHEYEPVNPPPDDAPSISVHPPTFQITKAESHEPHEEIDVTQSPEQNGVEYDGSNDQPPQTIEQIQQDIEDRFFNAPTVKKSDSSTQGSTTAKSSTKEEKLSGQGEGGTTAAPNAPSKFQRAIRSQTDRFKNKLSGMKRPSLPSRPKFEKPNLQRFKFHKPNLHLPKIPDTARISLPTFSLPRRSPNSSKRSQNPRQFSTESNAGDSKKNKYFDFSTYPRIFKNKKKPAPTTQDDFDSGSSKNDKDIPAFATVPRTKPQKTDDRWGGQQSIRISLHGDDSQDEDIINQEESAVEEPEVSHMRYDDDIDIDEAYEKENQEIHRASPFSHGYNSRWNHGSFHPDPNSEPTRQNPGNQQEYKVTDLDSPGEGQAPNDSFDTNNSKEIHSSQSSLGMHRRGVLEEIDSDEFFLRQKGISQDNIEVGKYLSSEIREAFKPTTNALQDMQKDSRQIPSYESRASNQSLPEAPAKRKNIKKPKRKKTPHVSQEVIPQNEEDSDPEEYEGGVLPPRPKRRSKRKKKPAEEENVIPYQETISLDIEQNEAHERTVSILQYADEEDREQIRNMYENEQMEGKDQPDIRITDPYMDLGYQDEGRSTGEAARPVAPPRRQKSLGSLNYSEHDSILGDFNPQFNSQREAPQVEDFADRDYQIQEREEPPRPVKPPRTLSRSSLRNREKGDQLRYESNEFEEDEPPLPPVRTRSRSGTRSQVDDDLTTSQDIESLVSENQPCIEEPCTQDFRDYMGYAVIDKNQKREPPLPPPKTPARRKKCGENERRFFTVPRQLNASEAPVRPLRNYSTLGPSRPPRRKPAPNMTDEEKENIEIDITQYIEIEDEPNRDLHSGEVIQKMQNRPLPAPPRPPRKTKALTDITSEENINIDIDEAERVEEADISTQTDQIVDDFGVQKIEGDVEATEAPSEVDETIRVERRLITPTHYTHEETITHGTLLVEPLNGAKILPDSDFTRKESPAVRTIPVTRDPDDFETSEIPEDFKKLTDPQQTDRGTDPQVFERKIERQAVPDSRTEVEVLRAQKLQVSDLDVDRLSVNELLASKIIVSEIDSGTILSNEIGSKSGSLKIGEIELPPHIVQQLFERLQAAGISSTATTESSPKVEDSVDSGQKKTPIDPVEDRPIPERPSRKNNRELSELNVEECLFVSDPSEISQTHSCEPHQKEETTLLDIAAQESRVPPEPPVRTDSTTRMRQESIVDQRLLEFLGPAQKSEVQSSVDATKSSVGMSHSSNEKSEILDESETPGIFSSLQSPPSEPTESSETAGEYPPEQPPRSSEDEFEIHEDSVIPEEFSLLQDPSSESIQTIIEQSPPQRPPRSPTDQPETLSENPDSPGNFSPPQDPTPEPLEALTEECPPQRPPRASSDQNEALEDSVIPDEFSSLQDPPPESSEERPPQRPPRPLTDQNEALEDSVIPGEFSSLQDHPPESSEERPPQLPPRFLKNQNEALEDSVIPEEFSSLQDPLPESLEESAPRRPPRSFTDQSEIVPEGLAVPEESSLLQEPPSEPPPRTARERGPPQRPPRSSKHSKSTDDSDDLAQGTPISEAPQIDEDDEPPPRPPQPRLDYIPSQPPASFYALRAQKYVESLEGGAGEEDIPMAPRRRQRHHHKSPAAAASKCSSSEDSLANVVVPSRRRPRTMTSSPEPSIPELTGQLVGACGSAVNASIKRLIAHISSNVLRNADGNQDLHVIIVMLIVLIAVLILSGYGDQKTVHHHHWEYFNPPRDL